MNKVLWRASTKQKKKSNLLKYENYLMNNYNYLPNGTYSNLLKWSIKNSKDFWSSIWDYTEVKGNKSLETILSKKLYKSKFLSKSKLNFAENILRKKDKDKAITFISENGYKEIKTWIELYRSVSKVVKFFEDNGINNNDRVVGYMPNIIETVEFFLASSAIGAIWSSCSPDFGTAGVIAGGVIGDKLREKHINGRLFVGFGVIVIAIPSGIAFLYEENLYLSYFYYAFFQIATPMWVGIAPATASDLVMPRMRGVAGAFYILMVSMLGLALGPYCVGKLSDIYFTNGLSEAEALRDALASGLSVLSITTLALIGACYYLPKEEKTRLERARRLGEEIN